MNKKFRLLLCCAVLLVCACSLRPSSKIRGPQETVEFYLQELAIIKNLVYAEKDSDKLIEIAKDSDRYVQAKDSIIGLIWKSGSKRSDRIRQRTFTSTAMILTYENYDILDIKSKDEFAFVTVVFKNIGYMGLNLGRASEGSNRPITYDLIRTDDGWHIKDMNGILAGMGF